MDYSYVSNDECDRLQAGLLLAAAALLIKVYFTKKPPKRLQQQPQQHEEQHRPRRDRGEVQARRRLTWCRDWLLQRSVHGDYDHLLQELHREDAKWFKNFLRIEPDFFHDMVERLTPILAKKETNCRLPLAVGLKLAVTLRFLATGNTYTSLQYSFRVSKSAISRFVPEVCQAIIDTYKNETLVCPTTPEDWNKVASDFARKWNYYNCGGALDGKHVAIQKPKHGGSLFYNYKKFHSIVLMALADANYKFLYVDVGAEGSAGDGGTWYKCTLHDAIERNRDGFPEDRPLPNDDTPIPFHIIGDDAFALKKTLMKPYSHQSQVEHEKIFSYRLSRARRVVENAFGLLTSRLRVFGTTMQLQPSVVKIITMCGCVMHNLILNRYPHLPVEVDHEDEEHNVIPGAWREDNNGLEGLYNPRGQNYATQPKQMRDHLAHYYSSEVGAVPWQENMVYPRGRPPTV